MGNWYMRSLYDENGLIRPAYKLANIVVHKETAIELYIPEDMFHFLYFRFQNKKFRFLDISALLDEKVESEILPGIYLRSIEGKTIFKQLINRLFRKKLFLLRNENRRDSFQICSELEELKPEYYGGDIVSTLMEYVNPQNVEQPGNLGGGQCGGCAVYSYFKRLGLLGENDINGYYFFRAEEALEATRDEEFFLERCRHNACFKTYEKILKEGYSENLEARDQIKVTYRNGKYYADEGKHRVCTMRRFGYSKEVPMCVTRCNDSSDDQRVLDKMYYSDSKPVLESCYNRYKRIGISSDDVRDLLKKPQATILDYLNKSKYSYEEILNHGLW